MCWNGAVVYRCGQNIYVSHILKIRIFTHIMCDQIIYICNVHKLLQI